MTEQPKSKNRIFASYDYQFHTDYPLGVDPKNVGFGKSSNEIKTSVEVTIRSRFNHKKLDISEIEELRYVFDT